MRALILFFTLFIFALSPEKAISKHSEYPGDTLIRVYGKITNSITNQTISAVITYEKLPYGDDMGIANSQSSDGLYKMFMVKSGKYLVRVSSQGFKPLEEEITIEGTTDNNELEKNFSLVPINSESIIKLDNLIFASGRAEISSSSYSELDELAKLLQEKKKMKVQLEGHTDFAGNAESNFKLSEERVEAVKQYLTEKGVKKNRIQLKAFGGTQPITEDRSPEGRRKNRRVEVRIISQ